MIDENRIANAYTLLRAAEHLMAAAESAEIVAELALADAKAALLLRADSPINGKNEELRNAQLAANLPTEHSKLRAAQAATREKRTGLRLAALGVEALRCELRLRELNAKAATVPADDEIPF